MTNAEAHDARKDRRHIRVAAVVILLASFVFLIWYLRHVVVLAFAALLVATVFIGATRLLRRLLPIPHQWALTIATIAILAFFALLVWFIWPSLSVQSFNLARELEGALSYVEAQTGIEMPEAPDSLVESVGSLPGTFWSNAAALAGSIVSGLTGFVLVVATGVFLASDPRIYREGLILLVPPRHHDRARKALNRTGRGLRLWILGQLVSMTIVGVLVGLGAWLIGLPSPLALGVVAALFEFLPLVGPFLGAIPGLLVAFTQGPTVLLWSVGLYIAVQQLESNMITPIVQRKAVSVPPAVYMLSVVAMGSLFGILGVVLSGPLTVAAFALTRALYVEETLGEDIDTEHGI